MDKKFTKIGQKRTKVHRKLKKMDKSGQEIYKWTKSGQKSVETKSKCRQKKEKKADKRKTQYRQNINKTSKSVLALLDKKWEKSGYQIGKMWTKTDNVNEMNK